MTGIARTFTVHGQEAETTVYFNPPIERGYRPHGLGLFSIERYNKIYKVRDCVNNLYYDDHVLTLLPGTYSIDDIHDAIEKELIQQFGITHFWSKGRKFSLTANNITHKCVIQSSFKIEFKTQPDSIGPLLLFSPKILEPNARHENDRPATNLDDHHVTITCNIITDVYSNHSPSHTLPDNLTVAEGG